MVVIKKSPKILKDYRKIKLEKIGPRDDMPGIDVARIMRPGWEETDFAKIRTHEYFGIDDNLYEFYIPDLIYKSLLYANGVGRTGTTSFMVIEITHLVWLF
ncbi:MAG: hypothetical protein WCF90_05495 [Methanomicrobiales archaeon]